MGGFTTLTFYMIELYGLLGFHEKSGSREDSLNLSHSAGEGKHWITMAITGIRKLLSGSLSKID